MNTDTSLSDYLAIRNVSYEWSESYDNKDWERLRKILAPSVSLDFSALMGTLQEGLNPDQYVEILKGAIGDKRLKTQHLLGAEKFERISDDRAHIWHQIRVGHQRYANEDLAEVINKGHAYGVTEIWYRKVDGVWKIDAVKPSLNWFEDDYPGTVAPQ